MPVCQRCGYKWKYEGQNKIAYCYRCNRVLERERKIKEYRDNPQKLQEIIDRVISEIKENED